MNFKLATFLLIQFPGRGCMGLVSLRTVTEVLVNHSTYLNCSTSVLSEDIHWYHYDVGAEVDEMKSVYDGQIYESYRDDFRVDIDISNDSKSYNLVILLAKSKYAGIYLCQLTGDEDDSISMQLIVLETPTLCLSNMRPEGIMGPNSCGIKPDELCLSCSIAYTGNFPPRLEWRTAGWNRPVVGNFTEETTNSIYRYNVTMKIDLYMDGSSYVCQTTRVMGTQYNCTSDVVRVLYFMNASHITDEMINDEVICLANTSSQSCRYKWMWSNETDVQIESNNQTLRIQKTGHHRCEATCEIGRQECMVTASLVYGAQMLPVYYTTTDSKAIDSGENLSAMLLIMMGCLTATCICVCLIVIALVLWFRRRRYQRQCQAQEITDVRAAGETSRPSSLVEYCSLLESPTSEQGESSKRTRAQVEDVRLGLMEDAAQESLGLFQENVHHDVNAKRLCMMRLKDDEQTAITGLTILNKELFVLFEQSSEVAVYQADVLVYMYSLTFTGLKSPVDIASSSKDNCLYITSRDRIFRVDENGELILSWPIEDGGGTLSVTQDQMVILSVWAISALREYSSNGKLIHEVRLPTDVHLLHAVKIKDHFAVSVESHMEHNVWLVDVNGSVIQAFDGEIKLPKYLAVNSAGCVFVVDQKSSCVLLLSPTLVCLKVIVATKDGIICPLRICLDEANSRIFVADAGGHDVKVIAFALQKTHQPMHRIEEHIV